MLPSLFTLSPDVSGRRAPFLSALVIPSGARNLHLVGRGFNPAATIPPLKGF